MNNLNGITPPPPPPPRNNLSKKRFSIRYKLLVVFGLLVVVSIFMLGLLALSMAKRAVLEKVETHLKDKAIDTAEVIDGRISAFWQFLEGIARMPAIRNKEISFYEKTLLLDKEAKFNKDIFQLNIADSQNRLYLSDGKIVDVSRLAWTNVAKDKRVVSEPFVSSIYNKLVVAFVVPVLDDASNYVGRIVALTDGLYLSDFIDDIVVGNTGSCSIESSNGVTIAYKDENLVRQFFNGIEEAKKNTQYSSYANILNRAIASNIASTGYYNYDGQSNIASYAKMKNTDWVVILTAPIHEFEGIIDKLRIFMYSTGILVLVVSLIITFLVATRMVRPIQSTVDALQGIAQGEGDLTVRLPLVGNDEITDLSLYFNQTIEKIGSSIKAIEGNADKMEEVGSELSSNMTETASSVHEISSNIDGVKQQALTQAASVTETASTIEEITRTIKQLNASIESQAASVAQSSSSIEEMVANIKSITGTLEKSDELIKELGTATRDGKDTLTQSNSVTQKIAEESGSLMEASSVIQHIASQTNLLAMNAAIEAAHAGEAGKGFAVVADEIRKLAEESSTQGKTITSTLKSLSGEIEGLSSSSKVVETKFNAIFSLAEEVKEMSHRLTEAMKEQENGSREVLTAIKDINSVTNEVQQGSAEMLKGSEGVAREMEKLDGLTRVISDSMNEMAAGATQISNAVNEVAEIANKNKMSIKDLVKEVEKFKV